MTESKGVFSESLANMLDKLTGSGFDDSDYPRLYSSSNNPSSSISRIEDSNFKAKLMTIVSNEENTLQVRILLPLADRDSIKISLEDSKSLNVKATFYNIFIGKSDNFEHTIPVSSSLSKGYPIDRTQKPVAKYTDGVLTISIPLVPKEIVEITLD